MPFPAAADPLLLLGHTQVEAFLPYVLWLFVRDFPRVPATRWSRRLPRAVLRISFAAGVVLLLLNLTHAVALVAGWQSPLLRLVGAFGRYETHTLYHATLFVLMLPTLPFLVWKARKAAADERRRVWLLLTGLVAGSAPMLVAVVVMTFWPAADAALSEPRIFRWLEVLVYAGTLSIPLMTAYAVLVQHALDVRLVVRKAVRYALARYTVLGAAIAPVAVLGILLFVHRHQSLAGLMTGPAGVLLAVAATLGFVMLGLRGRIVAGIDRRFFREQYDAAQTLHALVEGSRNVPDAAQLEELLLREIDRAFHIEGGALLIHVPESELLASPSGRCRPLAAASRLARHLPDEGGAMPVQLVESDPVIGSLPHEDHQWLADGGIRLLLPLVRASGELAGVLALGAKRSELPYTKEDLLLLATVAGAARVALEERMLYLSRAGRGTDADRVAAECESCGVVRPAEQRQCPDCLGRMVPSKVPLTLRAKFRLEARIGRGGMGVVYRATDLHLGRLVAVKTLPWVAPYLSVRLRREARAMAAVSHPNLATIYGIEFFHGIPILVVEYLPGGTLADRLSQWPLPWTEAVALGVTLAHAVDRIHDAGILHRDIKPSNVGFTADGTPKLLDFGLARAMDAARGLDLYAPASAEMSEAGGASNSSDSDSLTGAGAVAGTVAYLSPEAMNGELPDPAFDIWSLCVVLFEAIAGTNPMQGTARAQTVSNVLLEEVPDIRRYAPSCPAAVADFFREALHRDPHRRPLTGRALARRLRALQEQYQVAPAGPPIGSA
ncbi:MAG TPA: serine/threonine-protein kinase [Gemmatimonadales bacterium]|nr:serine/threonine-protein kinase [Gemmatimonadales bacterium]